MKAIILEDDIMKCIAIKNAINRCSFDEVDWCDNQEDGLQKIKNSVEQDSPYDLIVTDMQYPLEPSGEIDVDAGHKLIAKLKEDGIVIPIIVCSSLRLSIPGILGTVWYNRLKDINMDFREIISKRYS